jgi:hypothetical protein
VFSCHPNPNLPATTESATRQRGHPPDRDGVGSSDISYHSHHPQHAHSMLMLPAMAGPYSVAPWARRRFTTSCVASRSPPMPRSPGMTRTGPVIPGNTACSPTGRMGWRRFTTISDAQTRQTASSGGPWGGDREQFFPHQPTRDTHQHTPPATPQRPEPTTAPATQGQRPVSATTRPRTLLNSYEATSPYGLRATAP